MNNAAHKTIGKTKTSRALVLVSQGALTRCGEAMFQLAMGDAEATIDLLTSAIVSLEKAIEVIGGRP